MVEYMYTDVEIEWEQDSHRYKVDFYSAASNEGALVYVTDKEVYEDDEDVTLESGSVAVFVARLAIEKAEKAGYRLTCLTCTPQPQSFGLTHV